MFSLNWFKSETKKQMEGLQIEKQQLENELLRTRIELITPESKIDLVIPLKKLYLSLKLVNDVLTVVLSDGVVLCKSNASTTDFERVRDAKSEDIIIGVMSTTQVAAEHLSDRTEFEKEVALNAGINRLLEHSDFEIENNAIYMKGIKRSIPELLLEKFINVVDSFNPADTDAIAEEKKVQYEGLKKFWLKCCLNPNAKSAEDLYTFLAHHKVKIDRHGNFYAYRRVCSVKEQNASTLMTDAISNAYNKVKAVWKKSPKNFEICLDSEGEYIFEKTNPAGIYKGEWLGNLEELYLSLSNEKGNHFTDSHTHSFDYRVGQSASMPRCMGDDNNKISCSKGFHSASKAYDYSGFGDTPILMIVNPIDVLAVPIGEVGKLRVCRWFFAMTLSENEMYILDDDEFDVTELGDTFEEECLKDMTKYVQNSFAEEVERHTFQLPGITANEMQDIVNVLEKMKARIANRVVNLD